MHNSIGAIANSSIRCWLKDENTVTINPILTNAVGGIKLMVAEEDLEDAKTILADWEQKKKESYACVKCSSYNIEYVSTPRKISNWISAALTFLLGNYALTTDKVYHCFDCGHDSPEAMSQPPADA